MQKLFGTQEIAKMCQVAQGTVIRWIVTGRVKTSQLGSGQNQPGLD